MEIVHFHKSVSWNAILLLRYLISFCVAPCKFWLLWPSKNFFGLYPSTFSCDSSFCIVVLSGVTLSATGCNIFGSFSTAPLWKSKFTGFGPGDDKLLVGLSTNFVHSLTVSLVCGESIGSVSGLGTRGVSMPGTSCNNNLLLYNRFQIVGLYLGWKCFRQFYMIAPQHN